MDNNTKVLLVAVILMIVLLALIPIAKNSRAQKRWEEKNHREAEAYRQRWEQEKLARKIVEVKLLDGGSTQYKRGGLGGAALGGFIGGAPGAVVGAMMPSGKGVQKQKFAVKYANGEVAIRECTPGTKEHNELMKYVKWEEV